MVMIYLATYVYDQFLIFGHLQLLVLYLWSLISLLLSFSASGWHHYAARSERIKQRRAGGLSFPCNSKKSQASFSSTETKAYPQCFQKSTDCSESQMLPAQGTSLPLQLSKTQVMTNCQHHVKFCWVLVWASLCGRAAQGPLSWLVLCCRPKIHLLC